MAGTARASLATRRLCQPNITLVPLSLYLLSLASIVVAAPPRDLYPRQSATPRSTPVDAIPGETSNLPPNSLPSATRSSGSIVPGSGHDGSTSSPSASMDGITTSTAAAADSFFSNQTTVAVVFTVIGLFVAGGLVGLCFLLFRRATPRQAPSPSNNTNNHQPSPRDLSTSSYSPANGSAGAIVPAVGNRARSSTVESNSGVRNFSRPYKASSQGHGQPQRHTPSPSPPPSPRFVQRPTLAPPSPEPRRVTLKGAPIQILRDATGNALLPGSNSTLPGAQLPLIVPPSPAPQPPAARGLNRTPSARKAVPLTLDPLPSLTNTPFDALFTNVNTTPPGATRPISVGGGAAVVKGWLEAQQQHMQNGDLSHSPGPPSPSSQAPSLPPLVLGRTSLLPGRSKSPPQSPTTEKKPHYVLRSQVRAMEAQALEEEEARAAAAAAAASAVGKARNNNSHGKVLDDNESFFAG